MRQYNRRKPGDHLPYVGIGILLWLPEQSSSLQYFLVPFLFFFFTFISIVLFFLFFFFFFFVCVGGGGNVAVFRKERVFKFS